MFFLNTGVTVAVRQIASTVPVVNEVANSNYGRTCSHFGDIQRQGMT